MGFSFIFQVFYFSMGSGATRRMRQAFPAHDLFSFCYIYLFILYSLTRPDLARGSFPPFAGGPFPDQTWTPFNHCEHGELERLSRSFSQQLPAGNNGKAAELGYRLILRSLTLLSPYRVGGTIAPSGGLGEYLDEIGKPLYFSVLSI